ncbi:MAG: 16S rRNA (cytosine(967)-C(5))-methyltransferase [Firmicutes bacterium GWF2_51_9]|nr:MAG: 16S rRNA (cytosine(967)-C(5))-methyltransferase [Firmicutes bacterium GWF2_51_9]
MNARYLAVELIHGVLTKQAYANLSLKQRSDEARPIDRGLITQLVYGTLQNQIYCRNRWKKQVQKEPDALVASLLDMCVYQLMFLDKVPDYAVLDEAQSILRQKHRGSATGLINAVLRRIIEEGKIDIDHEDELERVALNTSLPTWILKMWVKQYGKEDALKCAYSLIQNVQTSIKVNPLKSSKEEMLEDSRFSPGKLVEDALRYQGNFLESEWFKDGKGILQDEASQMVVSWVGAKPGMEILDLCAAPGTKTAGMAFDMRDTGRIVALDLHEHRVRLIQEGMLKLGVTIVEPFACDSRDCASVLQDRRFDSVLADVPCSGLGVLRRKPDIKARIRPSDLDDLQLLQRQLLEEAGRRVKAGGTLVYSTCTLNKKENQTQVESFLKNNEEFVLVRERTIFPFEQETDGFYIAQMQRNP